MGTWGKRLPKTARHLASERERERADSLISSKTVWIHSHFLLPLTGSSLTVPAQRLLTHQLNGRLPAMNASVLSPVRVPVNKLFLANNAIRKCV